MSVASVVTRGFGAFGSVNLLPTLGYGAPSNVSAPICFRAASVFHPGGKQASAYHPGAKKAAMFIPGGKAGAVT